MAAIWPRSLQFDTGCGTRLQRKFNEIRISRKRKLVLHSSLSEALKTFDVPVSEKEEQVEKELLTRPTFAPTTGLGLSDYFNNQFAEILSRFSSPESKPISNSLREVLMYADAVKSSKTEPDELKES